MGVTIIQIWGDEELDESQVLVIRSSKKNDKKEQVKPRPEIVPRPQLEIVPWK